MPKENKKRGRRADKKRRLEEAEAGEPPKRQRHESERPEADAEYVTLAGAGAEEEGEVGAAEDDYHGAGERPFYGLLDDEEQEYFRKAGEILDTNEFPDAEERNAFVQSVYREAEGKELKLANSQSCSRLFERLLRLSTASQLKKVFVTFKEHFVPLVQHRFASHCCETLFERAAPVATAELNKLPITIDGSEPEPKMEDLFLEVVEELKDQLGWLMTDVFACHPLRVLLLVLSGQPIAQQAGKSGLHSKRKEHNHTIEAEDSNSLSMSVERTTPPSFKIALRTLITASMAGLDTNSLRSLAAHRTGNPTLQLLLRLELTQFGKAKAKDESSIIRLLIPEEVLTPDSPSSSFVVGLMYDPVGSRLLETIMEHAPAKTFKSIYRGFIKPKLEAIIKNDTAGYVVSKAIVRLGREDLEEAITILAPSIPSLVERNRLAIIRVLVDHAVYREADAELLAKQLASAYFSADGFDIMRLLRPTLPKDATIPIQPPPASNVSEKLHASLLAQSLLNAPPPLSPLIMDSLTTLPSSKLLQLAQDTQTSHAVVTAFTSSQSPIIARRKLIAALYGNIVSLAIHQCGSRVIDALWIGTRGLAFMRERVAEELVEAETGLREAHYGRRVWRNWKMDLYRRRRREWVLFAKGADESGNNEPFVGFPTSEAVQPEVVAAASTSNSSRSVAGQASSYGHQGSSFVPGEKAKKHMTALEKARERHARNKAQKERSSVNFAGTGANTAATGANASGGIISTVTT